MNHAGRVRRLREKIAATDVQAALITKPENVRYLSGFAGSAGALLITQGDALLVSDFRYELQAREQAPGFRFFRVKRMDEGVPEAVAAAQVGSLAFEPAHVTVSEREEWQQRMPGVRLVALPSMVEDMRLTKDEEELSVLRRAAEIADAAMAHVIQRVRAGRTERELALEAEVFMRNAGAEKAAFDVIVASGPRSAMPHAAASDRPLEKGDLVIIDLGARCDGYHSDLTRTVAVAPASPEARQMYAVCHSAQAEGLRAVKEEAVSTDVDRRARQVIEEAGYGEYFGHGLGHGVGLEIHEAPRLAPTEKPLSLRSGMVVTIEPGIYMPGTGGVRIEDLVAVRKDGAALLTAAPKCSELPEV